MEEEEVQEGRRDLSEGHLSSTSSAGPAGRGRSWWQTDTPQDQSDGSAGSSHTHADPRPSFALFPDLGSKERLSSALLPPDPSLLPGGLEVGTCDVASWRKKINLREVKMSSKEQKREEDRSRRRWDVNRDRQVHSAACRSALRRTVALRLLHQCVLLCEGVAVPELGRIPGAPVEEGAAEQRPTGTPVEP